MANIPLLTPIKNRISKIDPVTLSRTIFGLIIAICLTLTASTYYYYQMYHNQLKAAALLPKVLSATEIRNPQSVLDAVSRIVYISPNEPVKTATVADKYQLPQDPFFAQAEDGDKIIILTDKQKAILYRPSINKVIDISSVELDAPTSAPTAEPTVATPTEPTQLLPGFSGGSGKKLYPKSSSLKLN